MSRRRIAERIRPDEIIPGKTQPHRDGHRVLRRPRPQGCPAM